MLSRNALYISESFVHHGFVDGLWTWVRSRAHGQVPSFKPSRGCGCRRVKFFPHISGSIWVQPKVLVR